MDVFLLDNLYAPTKVIDEYESFIWTERQSSFGDFEIVLPLSSKWNDLRPGRKISHSESDQVMMVQKRHETVDSEGIKTLTVTGKTLDVLLERRAVIPPEGKPNWKLKASLPQAIKRLITSFATGNTSLGGSKDVIPEFGFLQDSDDVELIEFAITPKSVYQAIKEIIESQEEYTFGTFLDKEVPRVKLKVYKGVERKVIFGGDLDTLTDLSYFETDEDYYNVAYIWSREGGYRKAVGMTSTVGADRRVLTISAEDLDVNDEVSESQLMAQLEQRAKEELGKHRRQKVFDGKTTGLEAFKYGLHYKLGDTVTLVYDNEYRQKVRVSEYIFSHDAEGYRCYPSFTTIEDGA